MKTIHEVTKENEYTGEIETIYRGYSKREAIEAKREYWDATYRTYYAPK